MKVELEYTILIETTDDKGTEIEAALLETAKKFDAAATVNETDCIEMDDDEPAK